MSLRAVGGDEWLGGLTAKVFDDSRCLGAGGRDEMLQERSCALIYNEGKFFLFLKKKGEKEREIEKANRRFCLRRLTIAARLVLQTSYHEQTQMVKKEKRGTLITQDVKPTWEMI